jgi:glycosyltransferase involved in cell wall biosynthesis
MHDAAFLFEQAHAALSGLRVAVVTETFPPEVNGVAMTIGRLVTALQDRGHLVQLIRPRQDPSDRPVRRPNLEEWLCRGVPIPSYPGLKLGLPATQTLTRLWAEQRPDVVHVATEGPLGWSALKVADKLRLPVASGFHTNFHSYSGHYGLGFLARPIGHYLRRFHNRSLATMVPTRQMCRELEARGFENVRVVARGVDTELFRPQRRNQVLRATWRAARHDPVALYVGRIAAEKNLGLLMQVFEALRMRTPGARLVLVGDGPQRARLQREFPHCIFTGTKRGEELAMHYASADLFVFPSMTETFGNVTLEAMASALAVVAYDYAAAAEHVEHAVSGLLAPLGDSQAFIAHVLAIAGDSVRAAELRRQARLRAEQLDWANVYDAYETVLHEVMRRHAF